MIANLLMRFGTWLIHLGLSPGPGRPVDRTPEPRPDGEGEGFERYRDLSSSPGLWFRLAHMRSEQ
jgi:hypothetical protein